MATREITLAGQQFTVPIEWSDEQAAAAAIRNGHIASAREAFPVQDFRAGVQQATGEAQGGVLRQLAGGAAGKVADLLAGGADLLGVAPEFVEQTGRQREAREALPNQLAQGVGSAAVDFATLGRLRNLLAIGAAEGGLSSVAAAPGERLEQGAQGAALGLGGAGVGMLAERAIEAGTGAFRAMRQGARARADDAARAASPDQLVTLDAPDLDEAAAGVNLDIGDRMERFASGVDLGADIQQGASRTALVRDLDRIDFPLSPGQRSGNAGRRQLEAGLSSAPVTAGPFAELAEAQERRASELLVSALGGSGDELSPQVLDATMTRLGNEFQEISGELGGDVLSGASGARFGNEITAAARREIADITNRHLPESGLEATPIITNMREAMAEGPVSGRELTAWRSSLVNRIQSISRERGTSAQGSAIMALSDAVDSIDRVIGDVAPPGVAGRYQEARGQWRLLNSILKTQSVDQIGQVRPKTLANVLSREYPAEFRRGRLSGYNAQRTAPVQKLADAFDAVRGLSTIAPDIVANSGTPTRMFAQTVAQGDITPRSLLGLGARFVAGDAVSNAAMAAPSLPGGSIPTFLRRAGAAGAAQGELSALQGLLDEE